MRYPLSILFLIFMVMEMAYFLESYQTMVFIEFFLHFLLTILTGGVLTMWVALNLSNMDTLTNKEEVE